MPVNHDPLLSYRGAQLQYFDASRFSISKRLRHDSAHAIAQHRRRSIPKRIARHSVAMGFQLIRPSMGPIVGGFIAERLGWRWTIWVVAIAGEIVVGLSLLFCRETYQVKILSRLMSSRIREDPRVK